MKTETLGLCTQEVCLLEERCKQLNAKLTRYEQALGNIETLIDGKCDTDVKEGRWVNNVYASIQAQIDEARR